MKKTAQQIAKEIVNAYEQSKGVFTNKVNAEDLVPNTTDKNRAQYLFWVIQMDYSIKSSQLYKHANVLWESNPNWISTKYISSLADDHLMKMIKQDLHPRYPNEIFQRFRLNSQLLDDHYKSEAINIVRSATSAQDLLKRIRTFRGFGPKLGNFLTRTYLDVFNLQFNDIDTILPPVDIHDVRLTHIWGLVDTDEMTDKNINTVKQIWNEACIKTNVSWITFDKALWLIGSEGQRTENILGDYLINTGQDV